MWNTHSYTLYVLTCTYLCTMYNNEGLSNKQTYKTDKHQTYQSYLPSPSLKMSEAGGPSKLELIARSLDSNFEFDLPNIQGNV